MNMTSRVRPSLSKMNVVFTKNRSFRLSTVLLILMLTVNVLPVGAVSTPFNPNHGPDLQTVSTLTFISSADSYVESSNPATNYGSQTQLRGDGSPVVRSYLRFNVQGVTGTVTGATLRVYANSALSGDYEIRSVSDNTWVESTITYNNAPTVGNVLNSSGGFSAGVWTSVNVTTYITGNGTYNLALTVPGSTAISFASRESGANAPQLIVETQGGSTSTVTPLPASTSTHTKTVTPPSAATPTRTPTAIASQVNSPTPAGGNSTFTPTADAYIESSNPSTNYGSLTTLRADGSPDIRSYLRFNIQGLSGTVTNATLRVYANSSANSGYEARSVSNNTWTESTITYNNAPPVGNVLGSYGSVNGGTWTNINITSYITGNGTYNLGLTTSGSTALSLASRESGANAPQLVIQTQGGTAPTATRTPTSASNPTATRTPTSASNPTATRTPTSASNPTQTPTRTATASSGDAVLVGAGDISKCSNNDDEATAKLLDGISGTVFTTGDNVYENGTYSEYINCYDPTWGRHKTRTKPSPGNHDYNTSGAAGYFQYFNNVPSYYAYNLGAWRIYALSSEIDVSASGAQATWLQSDLAANSKLCVLAYWHKPRWSSGTAHGSASGMQAIWQILYNAGAEVVVTGHEHNYERFAQMNATGATVSQGLREFVVGTGGASHYGFGSALSSSEVRNSSTFGVLKLTLHASSYNWQFVPVAGSTFTDSGSSNCH